MSENKKMTSWTPSQEEAIYKKGCQLLVAAGAGSGKTSVLTERILEKILAGCDIDGFLVVTFTVSSAEDMKEKLRKKLLEEYSKDTGNGHLSKQIAKLPFAQISTITAFCLKLVKQNFSSLNLPAGLRVADEGESKDIFKTAVDVLLDDLFEKKDENLHKILKLTACRGDEKPLADYLTFAYKKLRAHPDYINKLKAVTANFSNYTSTLTDSKSLFSHGYEKLFEDTIESLCSSFETELCCLEEICSAGEKLMDAYNIYSSYFHQGIELAKEKRFTEASHYFSMADSFNTNGWKKANASKVLDNNEKKAYDELKKTTREKAKKLSYLLSEIENIGVNDAKLSSELMQSFENLIIQLDEIYSSLKKEKGILDFTDTEQFAYKLLIDENGTPTPLCKEISATTTEVLIDEYQDTSPLQDSIFSVLATKDNRFMVGDDKQSIYRFRNAYPDIFNGYKKAFNTEKASCVFLRENFRCSEEIINFTNGIFNFLWGEAYKKEALIFQKKSPFPKKEAVTVKTFITDLPNKEASVYEASYIADEIIKLKDSYIKENGEPLQYSDIAILIPVAKNITDIFIDVISKKGIPVSSKKQGLLTQSPEIKLMISILKAINNPEEDVSLASAMNSFFFGFSADDLAKIREHKESSLWSSVLSCCKGTTSYGRMLLKAKKKVKGQKREAFRIKKRCSFSLTQKCKSLVKRLDGFREKANSMECKQLLWELLENEGILYQIEKEPDGEIKKNNLLLLYSQAIEFGRKEYKTLSAFLKYSETLDAQTYSPEGLSSVSVMTIHSSKGLEYPVCFIANCGKPFRASGFGAKEPIVKIDKGVFLPLRDGDFETRTSIFYTCEELAEKPADLEEKKRLLYVALTRAREKLYVVGSSSEKFSLRNAFPTDDNNYLSWILTAHPEGIYLDEILDTTVEEIEDEEVTAKTEIKPLIIEEETEDSFVYPYAESVSIPRKLSVSELKKSSSGEYVQSVKRRAFLTVPQFALEKERVSGAEIGTANHTFMQFAHFENCVAFGVEYEAQRLLLTNMLTDEQYGMLNFQNLKGFFLSDIWKRIQKSPKVYREKRFTVADNSKALLGVGDETVLVQGVIDLFFENEDGTYTVVDYKTDKIRAGEEKTLSDRYSGQLSYYAKAVEEITGKKVTDKIIYSFALGKEISVDL